MLERCLSKFNPKTRELDLSNDENLSDSDFNQMCEFIKANSVTSLNLSKTNISSNGIYDLVIYLNTNTNSLVSLDVSETNLGMFGASALSRTTTLKKIKACGCAIDDNNLMGLVKNKSILQLDLRDNLITDMGARLFLHNQTLISARLEGNRAVTNTTLSSIKEKLILTKKEALSQFGNTLSAIAQLGNDLPVEVLLSIAQFVTANDLVVKNNPKACDVIFSFFHQRMNESITTTSQENLSKNIYK